MKHSPSGIAEYTLAFVGLAMLATASLLFSFVNLGRAQVGVAVAIATLKALIILLIFIGLWRSRSTVIIMAIVTALLSLAMLGFILMDVATR